MLDVPYDSVLHVLGHVAGFRCVVKQAVGHDVPDNGPCRKDLLCRITHYLYGDRPGVLATSQSNTDSAMPWMSVSGISHLNERVPGRRSGTFSSTGRWRSGARRPVSLLRLYLDLREALPHHVAVLVLRDASDAPSHLFALTLQVAPAPPPPW